uniref:Uncharacterized protein n=1 Tax=Peronospora matthiolae TaxID=2874970 RepID=A0AAV1UTF2_9STRA
MQEFDLIGNRYPIGQHAARLPGEKTNVRKSRREAAVEQARGDTVEAKRCAEEAGGALVASAEPVETWPSWAEESWALS